MEFDTLFFLFIELSSLMVGLFALRISYTGATIITSIIIIAEFLMIGFTQNGFMAYMFIVSIFLILPILALTNFIAENFSKYPNTIAGKPRKDKAIEKAREEGRYVTAYLVKQRT